MKDLTNAFSGPKNDVESIVVRRGCTLRVYKDSDFSDGEYVFSAPTNTDLFIKDLEDDSSTEYLSKYYKYYIFKKRYILFRLSLLNINIKLNYNLFLPDEEIESVKCNCKF